MTATAVAEKGMNKSKLYSSTLVKPCSACVEVLGELDRRLHIIQCMA